MDYLGSKIKQLVKYATLMKEKPLSVGGQKKVYNGQHLGYDDIWGEGLICLNFGVCSNWGEKVKME